MPSTLDAILKCPKLRHLPRFLSRNLSFTFVFLSPADPAALSNRAMETRLAQTLTMKASHHLASQNIDNFRRTTVFINSKQTSFKSFKD
jgi:hypothetical protein